MRNHADTFRAYSRCFGAGPKIPEERRHLCREIPARVDTSFYCADAHPHGLRITARADFNGGFGVMVQRRNRFNEVDGHALVKFRERAVIL